MMLSVIVGGVISLLTAGIGVLLALRIQLGVLEEKGVEREAWEKAQEGHQVAWQMQERKSALFFEQQIVGQIQHVQEEWQRWEARFNDHSHKLSQEYMLNSLPTVEETPLSLDGHHHLTYAPPDWQPPMFFQADFRERDFSHRYLGKANFREAQLAGANFYMADLRDTCLAGADLSGACLIGANLTNADLRGANMAGANLLVADLHEAILYGANLSHVRNLTTQQMYGANYDHTTRLDPDIDITMTRVPATPGKNVSLAGNSERMQKEAASSLLSQPSSSNTEQSREAAGFPPEKPDIQIDTPSSAMARMGQSGRGRAKVS